MLSRAAAILKLPAKVTGSRSKKLAKSVLYFAFIPYFTKNDTIQ